MKSNNITHFRWDVLLDSIHHKNVIPVIGQGLYWVHTIENKEVLLYQYLAEKLTQEMGFAPIDPELTNHVFSRAVFKYLQEKPNDYLGLQEFLTSKIATLYPIPSNPLWKLSRIKPFSLFINTTYDQFLEHILKSVRNYPIELQYHTYLEKRVGRVTTEQLERLDNSQSSLVFHIYGNPTKNSIPAYTEKDILETVVTFQKDMEINSQNPFFQTLKEKSLLFIGCGYDDWLFRFFIRTISNEPYNASGEHPPKKFVSDHSNSPNCDDLVCFLKSYNSEVFFSSDGKDFVDTLFDEMYKRHPEDIIKEVEFPAPDIPDTAFISFHGDNRDIAKQLASELTVDGVKVWLDELKLKPGDVVDKTILKAIEKCQVFIPLISEAAKQFQKSQTETKYHIREWEWAYSRFITEKNPRIIIPVKIDDTGWLYDTFKNFVFIEVPGGNRGGDYEKLKVRLLESQQSTTR